MDKIIEINGVKYKRIETEKINGDKGVILSGYERGFYSEPFYFENAYNINNEIDKNDLHADVMYDNANYYNDYELAKNNMRADLLMRRLRQWQGIHDKSIHWSGDYSKYFIGYDYYKKSFKIENAYTIRYPGQIYFSSKEKVQKVIDLFYGELTWYFNEYIQRLDESTH